MDLYKSEGVNPLGGCLPVLLKIPFFIALFWVLQGKEFLALINEPGISSAFLWIADISKPDPLRILPVLVGITTFFMQKSMPSTGQQNNMMIWIMPIFLVIISVNFPTGVQIYWLVSNLIAAVQQTLIMKKVK